MMEIRLAEATGADRRTLATDLFSERLLIRRALLELDSLVLDPEVIQHTLGVLLKYHDDIARVQGGEALRLMQEAQQAAKAMAGAIDHWGADGRRVLRKLHLEAAGASCGRAAAHASWVGAIPDIERVNWSFIGNRLTLIAFLSAIPRSLR